MDRTVCCHGSPLALCKVCGQPVTTSNVEHDTVITYVSVECPDCRQLKEQLKLWKEAAFFYAQAAQDAYDGVEIPTYTPAGRARLDEFDMFNKMLDNERKS